MDSKNFPSLCIIQKLTSLMMIGLYGILLYEYPLAVEPSLGSIFKIPSQNTPYIVWIISVLMIIGGHYRKFSLWSFFSSAILCLFYVLSLKHTFLNTLFHPLHLLGLWLGLLTLHFYHFSGNSFLKMCLVNILSIGAWFFSPWAMGGMVMILCMSELPKFRTEQKFLYIGSLFTILSAGMIIIAAQSIITKHTPVIDYHSFYAGLFMAGTYFTCHGIGFYFKNITIPTTIMIMMCGGLLFTCSMMMGYNTAAFLTS